MLLPFPKAGYATWQDWGNALIRKLTEVEFVSAASAPSYQATLVPSKGEGGQFIWVSNTEKLAYWKPSTSRWRYVDESGNV
jgi:hypothetical protein